MVVFDSVILALLVDPQAEVPEDAIKGAPVLRVRERLDLLLSEIEDVHDRVLIPTPVLFELLALAGAAAPNYFETLSKSSFFRIVGFDQRAALEAASLLREGAAGTAMASAGAGLGRGDLSQSLGPSDLVRLQIVAIAKVHGADTLYAEDPALRRLAQNHGIEARRLADMPEPIQPSLPFG